MNKRTLFVVFLLSILLTGCRSRLGSRLSGTWQVSTVVTEYSYPECADSFLAQSQSMTFEMRRQEQAVQGIPRGGLGSNFAGKMGDAILNAGLGAQGQMTAHLSVNPPDNCIDYVTLEGRLVGNQISGSLDGHDCADYCYWSGDFIITIEPEE